ncbi:type II toxin-antitoxin system HicA family toxin [Nostoc sp.]|uniref:type II toxin-antitoxin system HicA family toxin n=1 Tax=Nostoc sp. TaxID=1180 RepID=UPI003FA5CC09
MSVKRKELIKYLEQNGFYLLREGGNHSIYTNDIKTLPVRGCLKRVGLSLKYDSGVHSQIPKLRFSGSSFLVARVVKHTLEDFSNIL